jgi:glucose-6-phosphate isomerase
MSVELPDEAVTYHYQNLLVPAGEEWNAPAELRARHFVHPARLREILPRLLQCRSQVAGEREVRNPAPDQQPLDAGFIDLPGYLLDQHRRRGDASHLARTLALANRLREEADTVIVLGAGGSSLGARALFEALKSAYHNELPAENRLGWPRVYFAGDNADNDSLQDLLELLQVTCVDPDNRAERWAVLTVSKSGSTLEPAVALRVFRREALEYYGPRSEWLDRLFAAVTGPDSNLRELFTAFGTPDDEVLTIPANVGGRFSVFTPAGLLPAAVMGLDVRALLLGASAMTKRFLEETFDRNPVLQYAAVNYLMHEELHKPLRVLAVWSAKLEALGRWYDHLLAESLSRLGRGPTPLTAVQTRDLHSRGQHLQEGPRDRVIHNVVVKSPRNVPILVQMADHNEDDLNQYARKGLPDLMSAARQATSDSYFAVARPAADIVLPALTEHTLGQLLQMLMLATVVEGRLMGLNPYGQPAADAYKRNLRAILDGGPTE